MNSIPLILAFFSAVTKNPDYVPVEVPAKVPVEVPAKVPAEISAQNGEWLAYQWHYLLSITVYTKRDVYQENVCDCLKHVYGYITYIFWI